MDYSRVFTQAIDRLHAEGRYRVFIDILRNKGMFPNARCFAGHNGPKPITVWCSNDYLSMGQHPKVIAAMEEALHDVGAGSGGTRNIGGNTHYHIDHLGVLPHGEVIVRAPHGDRLRPVMPGEAARIGEHALVAQDVDEDPIAPLGMKPIDRLGKDALIIQRANSLTFWPRFTATRRLMPPHQT